MIQQGRSALAIALALASGCADDGSVADGDVRAPVSIGVEVAGDHDGELVVVEGALLAAPSGPPLMCEALAEPYPPQCGGERVEVVGLDVARIGGMETNDEAPDGQQTTWSDGPLRLVGQPERGRLVVVRPDDQVAGSDQFVRSR